MRRLLVLAIVAGMFALTLGAPERAQKVAAAAPSCFAETGRCIEGAFRDYWQAHGALEIIGLPITPAFVDDRGLIVQFFERAILEWHPENGPDYQVLLTRLGADRLGGRKEAAAPPEQPCLPPSCALLAQTNHTLRGTFLDYWTRYGGLAVFGFPLTEQFTEISPTNGQPYVVQYFERNRFELHPENAGSRYEVLLGLLGAELLKTQPALANRPGVQVPEFSRVVGLPQRILVPAIGVDAAVEQVGVDASNAMDTPKNPHNVGWYAPGPRPGQRGNAAIDGHVDYAGIGPVVFWRLSAMKPGDEIIIVADDGARWRFITKSVETFPVGQFPGNRVFGATDETNLSLISCIGDFDPVTASYNKRIIAFATWDGVIPSPRR